MPVSIETALFCAQYFSNWEVTGKSGVYSVTMNGAEAAPFCSCPAFKFSGPYGDQDCKHVRLVWEHACLWNPQWRDECPNDYEEHGIKLVSTSERDHVPGEECPKCGGPVVPVKIAV